MADVHPDGPAPAVDGRVRARSDAPNPTGVAAVVVAATGSLLAVVPPTLVAGWALLPAALLLGVVALGLPGRRRGSAVTALAVFTAGVLGGVVVVLLEFARAVDDAVG